MRSPFLDNELVKLAYQAPAEISLTKDLTHRLIAECSPELANIPTDRGRMLHKGAVASKLDVFRQEFMPRAEYVYDYGMPQWLAKVDRLMTPLHIERLFLGRQKFTHFRVWYRNELSNYIKQILLPRSAYPFPALSKRATGRGSSSSSHERARKLHLGDRQAAFQRIDPARAHRTQLTDAAILTFLPAIVSSSGSFVKT